MALKIIFLYFLIAHAYSYSFHAPNNIKTECTKENYKNLGINPEEVSDCKDVQVEWKNLGDGKFWLILNHFYNLHYYDLEVGYDRQVTESIVDREFDVRRLVTVGNEILFVTDNKYKDFTEFRQLQSIHDYETKTSLLMKKNSTVNGIVFNKYHIRNIDNMKHIVIEFKNTEDTYEKIYYNNLLEAKILNKTKNDATVNLNINVDYSRNHNFVRMDVRVMNVLIYWNAVAMLFSGLENKFNIKIKKINFAENAGLLFPNGAYLLFDIQRSLSNYFVSNRVSDGEDVDIQVAMTESDICLRTIGYDCDIQGYTLLLISLHPIDAFEIAVIRYTPSLFNYNVGAREISHSLGINYHQRCDGIMNRKKSNNFTWCKEDILEFEDIKKTINTSHKNRRDIHNTPPKK